MRSGCAMRPVERMFSVKLIRAPGNHSGRGHMTSMPLAVLSGVMLATMPQNIQISCPKASMFSTDHLWSSS